MIKIIKFYLVNLQARIKKYVRCNKKDSSVYLQVEVWWLVNY